MRSPFVRWWLSAGLLALTSIHAFGQRVLQQVPVEATGFVVVHDLQSTSEKIEQVAAIFQKLTPAPLPAPLALALGATGLGPGIDQRGNALLVLMPSDDAPLTPQPLLLIPVTDYAAFAESTGGDATGEICRVTIAEEEVLLARRGEFAALTNVEHRMQLERFLSSTPTAPPELAELADWIASTDVAAGLTRAGVERLTALARREASDARLESAGRDSPEVRQLQESLQQIDDALQYFGAEMRAGVVGLTIDDSANVKVAKRVILTDGGTLSKLSGLNPPAQSPFERFEKGAFVLAAGGPIPDGFGDALAASLRQYIEAMPAPQGYRGLTGEDWQKLEESYRESGASLKSLSFVLRPGKGDEGLLSNYFVVAESADAPNYLKSYRRSFELYNEVMEAAENDLSLPYELSEAMIDGHVALLAEADVAAAAADPNVAGVDPLMRTIFGPDGKMSIYAIVADPQTVLIGSAAEAKLAEGVEFALTGGDCLTSEQGVGATLNMLDPKSPWKAIVSPQGLVAWIGRAAQILSATFGGDMKAPPFPATPPIGFSFNLGGGQLHSEVVVPRETLQGIADYLSDFLAE